MGPAFVRLLRESDNEWAGYAAHGSCCMFKPVGPACLVVTGAHGRAATFEGLILTPGPVMLTSSVKRAMWPDVGSRDRSFELLSRSFREQLLELANGTQDYEAIPVGGSATFAMEAAIRTLIPPREELLVLDNGMYARRVAEVAEQVGINVRRLPLDPRKPLTRSVLEELAPNIAAGSWVALVHCETATGLVNELKEFAEFCRGRGLRSLVDGVSSLGAVPIDLDGLGIDALVASANKCIEGPPGIGLAYVHKTHLASRSKSAGSYVLDLRRQWRSLSQTDQWVVTPPTHVVQGAGSALTSLLEEGVAARSRRYARLTDLIRGHLVELRLKPTLDRSHSHPGIVAVDLPPSCDYPRLHSSLRDEGMLLYHTTDVRTRSFRISVMGDVSSTDVQELMSSLQRVATNGVRL